MPRRNSLHIFRHNKFYHVFYSLLALANICCFCLILIEIIILYWLLNVGMYKFTQSIVRGPIPRGKVSGRTLKGLIFGCTNFRKYYFLRVLTFANKTIAHFTGENFRTFSRIDHLTAFYRDSLISNLRKIFLRIFMFFYTGR